MTTATPSDAPLPATTPVASPKPNWADRFRMRFLGNPVVLKELRSRMRGRRAFVVLTLYLLLLSGFSMLIYASANISAMTSSGPGPQLDEVGKLLFGGLYSIEIFLVCFITPAFTAASISGEREHQTLDLLRTTLLSPRRLVFGKLISALSYVFLLIFAAIPLQSMAFLLGGIGWEELIIGQLLLVVSAIAFASLGLWCSAITRTTLASTVTTYGIMLLTLLAYPLLMGFVISITVAVTNNVYGYSTPAADAINIVLMLFTWFFIVTVNPATTVVLSETILRDNHSLWYMENSVSGTTLYLPSPWMLYSLVYLFFSMVLFLLAVRRVRQVER